MIEIAIPGFGDLKIEHAVFDYNGTLAVGGVLTEGVRERLINLAQRATVHVITADTFGLAQGEMEKLPCKLVVLPPGGQDAAKLAYVERLGAQACACVGNGRNDRLMLGAAGLGIAVLGGEGAASEALAAARIVTSGIAVAIDLLLHPLRLVATLRA